MGEAVGAEEPPRVVGSGAESGWGLCEEISGFAHASMARVLAVARGECVRATWIVDVAAESARGVLEGPTEVDTLGRSEACESRESEG